MKYILLLLISFPVFADFNGKFSGTGAAVFHSGKRYDCTEVFLDLESSQTSFKLHQRGYICGFLKASFDAFEFKVKEGKLYYGDLEMGEISDQELNYHYYDPQDNSTYFLTLTQDGEGGIHYLKEWYDGEKLALTVKGKLSALK